MYGAALCPVGTLLRALWKYSSSPIECTLSTWTVHCKEVCTTSVNRLVYLHGAVGISFRNLTSRLRLSKHCCSGLCMDVVVGLGPAVQTRLLYKDMSYKAAISSPRFSSGTFNILETLTAPSEECAAWAWKGWGWWGRLVAPFPFQVCLCSCAPASTSRHLHGFSYLLPTYTGWDVYGYTTVSSSSTFLMLVYAA